MRLLAYLPRSLSALVLLAGGWLSSCSSADSLATTTTGPVAPVPSPSPPAPFPFGTKVDSLNGILGHAFGQPVRAFPPLQALPIDPALVLRSYRLRDGQAAAGWFGRHTAQVPTQLYSFLDGRFARFRAVGDAATLRAEARYLLGPGQAQGSHQLFWEGSRARAAYTEELTSTGWEGRLDILSKPLEAEQAAQAQARLQADNAR